MENNAENIFMWNSQEVESFFRLLRSYTGVESTIVNCSMKSFISRVQKIQLEESLMRILSQKYDLKFPKILSRQAVVQKSKSNFSLEKIYSIVESATNLAVNDASQLGMNCDAVNPELFLKPTTLRNDNSEDLLHERENDFLEACLEIHDNSSAEPENAVMLDSIEFSDEKSSKL